jgi:hypothetical protein
VKKQEKEQHRDGGSITGAALDPWAWSAKENAKPGLILRADGQQSVSKDRAPRPASTGAPFGRGYLSLTFLQD